MARLTGKESNEMKDDSTARFTKWASPPGPPTPGAPLDSLGETIAPNQPSAEAELGALLARSNQKAAIPLKHFEANNGRDSRDNSTNLSSRDFSRSANSRDPDSEIQAQDRETFTNNHSSRITTDLARSLAQALRNLT